MSLFAVSAMRLARSQFVRDVTMSSAGTAPRTMCELLTMSLLIAHDVTYL